MKSSSGSLVLGAEPDPAAATIRKARREDFGTVCRLMVEANLSYQWVLPPPDYQRLVAGALDLETRLQAAEILVAERGGKVVGTASYQRQGQSPWPERWAVVQALAVDGGYHRQGIGGALIDTCVRYAMLDRAAALGVHAPAFVRSSLAVYQSRGFRREPLCDVDLGEALAVPLGLLAYALPIRSPSQEVRR